MDFLSILRERRAEILAELEAVDKIISLHAGTPPEVAVAPKLCPYCNTEHIGDAHNWSQFEESGSEEMLEVEPSPEELAAELANEQAPKVEPSADLLAAIAAAGRIPEGQPGTHGSPFGTIMRPGM